MRHKSLDDLSDLQRSVMEILWEIGETTVNDVRDRLSPDRSLAYTSVLSAMQKLEKGGWLGHRSEGRNYVYYPSRTREQEGIRSLRKIINRVFQGDPLLLFQSFIKGQDLSEKELARLEKIIEEHRKEVGDA